MTDRPLRRGEVGYTTSGELERLAAITPKLEAPRPLITHHEAKGMYQDFYDRLVSTALDTMDEWVSVDHPGDRYPPAAIKGALARVLGVDIVVRDKRVYLKIPSGTHE